MSLTPDRLTVRLGFGGRVLDGPLARRIKPSEACWSLSDADVDVGAVVRARGGAAAAARSPQAGAAGGGARMAELLLLLPKEEAGRYWRALFDGGEAKSHLQVLAEAVANDDDARHAPSVEELGPAAAALLEDLRERQAELARGEFSFEGSVDAPMLVLGDGTM